ncbi:MAG: response regulator [Leptospiraceae bacterium]|nr:response regulator [Leptospiraceae bacterium]MCP5494047.1 response regulator [Leptospiraceae bacterium]
MIDNFFKSFLFLDFENYIEKNYEKKLFSSLINLFLIILIILQVFVIFSDLELKRRLAFFLMFVLVLAYIMAIVMRINKNSIHRARKEIEARKQAEEKLKELNHLLEEKVMERTKELRESQSLLLQTTVNLNAILNSTQQSFILLDFNYKILAFNEIARIISEKMFEKKIQIGEPILDFVVPSDFDSFYSNFQKTLTGQTVFIEKQISDTNGKSNWFACTFNPVRSKIGDIMGVCLNISEITIQKNTELALVQARKDAESANKAKTEFLSNMSHEIRTPMNAILGFSEILSSHIDNEEQKSSLEAISSSGKTLLSLINDILDLSKIEAGKMDIQYETIEIQKICEEIRNIFSLKLSEKHLEFKIDIQARLPNFFILDEVRLRQILFNTIGNAIKFTEKGKIILRIYTTSGQLNTSNLHIEIEDTGIGIPEEEKECIFDAFRQRKNQESKMYGGTGLGLAITKRLVDMMNGSISIRSELGKGSTFQIVFFQVLTSETLSETRNINSFDYRNIIFNPATVLIADDIPLNRTLFIKYFHGMNIAILEAENGLEAIKLAEQKPDLIIMDIQMPVLNGYEATKKIKNSNPSIPIIALTAFALKDELGINFGEYFNCYLVKPIQRKEFIQVVSKYLKHTFREKPQEDIFSLELSSFPEIKIEIFDKEALKYLPNIIHELENSKMETWVHVCKHKNFQEIELFGKEIKNLGQHYQIEVLEKYGNEIVRFSQNFDILQIQNYLDIYPTFVEKLKKLS